MRKVRLGFLVALVAVLAIAGSAWAGTSESSNDIDLAAFDIYRTGTPDYDLVWEFYTQFDIRVLEHLPRAGVPRPDGYYWVIVRQEERDVIDEMVEELQQIMGEDFPIAVSVSSPAPIDEANKRAMKDEFDKWVIENDIYRKGTPDLDLVMESIELLRDVMMAYPSVVAFGARIDGYYSVTIREENWDVIHAMVEEIQQMMGEDFPISVDVGNPTVFGDVFGGHRTTIQHGPLNFVHQTLAFAAASAGQAGMVLSGHWLDQVMPVNAWVYSPTSRYPLPTNRIGIIDRAGGVYSDSSYMRPAWPGGDRVRAGVQHYGSHMPVWGSEDPELGSYVYKTGQTTGTTLAYVWAVGWAQAPWHPDKLHEQYFAIGHAAEGDSGAPVYWVKVIDYPIPNGWWPPDPEFAILKGVLSAGSEVDFIFSTISQVIDDLDVWPLPGPFW